MKRPDYEFLDKLVVHFLIAVVAAIVGTLVVLAVFGR